MRKADVVTAKNYLSEKELDALNRIVTVYLEFAELQALDRKPMSMRDWIAKLDDFLRLSGRSILEHAGKITAEEAKLKAELEFDKFELKRRALEDANADAEFTKQMEDLAKQTKQLGTPKRKPSKK